MKKFAVHAGLAMVAAVMLLSGCTGTQIHVNPDPASMQLPPATRKCGTVAVRELTPTRIYAPAGNPTADFARELVQSGMFDTVYYPSRADDKADITLEGKFDVGFEPHMGANMAKSFVVGFSLFLLEPVFWYDYGYDLQGRVDIYGEKQLIRSVDATSHGEMSMKFLSLAEVTDLEQETLDAAKRSLYRQLLVKIGDYCGSRK